MGLSGRRNRLTKSNFSGSILDMKKVKQFFTVQDVAKMLGISRQAIDKRIKVRKIPTETYGRTRLITKLDINGLIK